MAKLSIEYGKTKKDGSRSVMIRLVSGRTQKHIPTHVNLEKKDFKEYPDGRIRITNNSKYFEVEDYLSELKKKVNEVLRIFYGTPLSADDIAERVFRPSKNDIRMINFFDFTEKWLEQSDIKTKFSYTSMMSSLQKFLGQRYLPLGDINVQLLTRYCNYLKGKRRAQTMYLGCIRRIYKVASLQYNTDDEIVLSPYLFERFKIPAKPFGGQRALSVEELVTFFKTDAVSKREQLAKDYALLSLCLMGTNLVDMYNATYYDGRVFAYERMKTKDRRSDKAHIEIIVHERIKPVFDKYAGKKGNRILRIGRYKDYMNFYGAINRGLRSIKKRLGWNVLQFYQFRHSWASIARNEIGIDKATVDEGLNHVGSNRIADIYIKKDFRLINEANRKVVDFILDKI